VETSFKDVVKEKNLEPVGEPELDLEKIDFDVAKPLSYQCEVEVKPAFEAPQVSGLRLVRPSEEVTEQDFEATLKRLLRRVSEVHPVSEPAQAEDFVIADARVSVDGKEAWKDQELTLALMEDRVLGLPFDLKAAELLGARAGEKKSAAVELPVNFRIPAYAGKAAQVEIEVKDVKRPKLPELTDDLAKRFGAESAEAFRATLRERMAAEKKVAAEEDLKRQVIDQLVAETRFELPEKLLARASARNELRRHYRLQELGVSGESLNDQVREELQNVSRQAAERELRAYLILEKLAKAHGLEAADKEVDEHLAELARRRGADAAGLKRHAEEHGELEMIKAELAERKVLNFIIEKADIRKGEAPAPAPEGHQPHPPKAAEPKEHKAHAEHKEPKAHQETKEAKGKSKSKGKGKD